MKKLTWLMLLLAMLVIATMTACTSDDPNPETDPSAGDATTAAPTEDATDDVTAAPTDEATTTPNEEQSETPSEDASENGSEDASEDASEEVTEEEGEITDGMMLYFEDFSSYNDVEGLEATLEALGWVYQTRADHGVYSDWSNVAGTFSLSDGRLVVKNYDPQTGLIGTDGYFLMLDYDYMEAIADYGDYTLQYDVTYYDASDCGRYFCIVTDYNGNSYNSFHFRIGGYGNNQGHHYKNNGDWITYDIIDPVIDLSAKLNVCDPEKGTTIAYKLLGIEAPIGGSSDTNKDMFYFKDVTVTIRIQHDDDVGQTIYMKTADMEEFVCVSAPHETAGGAEYWYDLTGYPGLAFKVAAAINGHLDNIAMWAGFGDMPEDTTVTYKPAA